MDQKIESSSDEDDAYTNSVARLRALKKRRFEKELVIQTPIVANVEIIQIADTNGKEEIIQTETNITNRGRYRGRGRPRSRGRPRRNTTVRSPRGRHPPVDNLEYDVEIVSVDEKPTITESSKDDAIALSSDDETRNEDDNYEMSIKVLWRHSRIDRLNMRRYDNFLKIFEHYADLEKVSVNEILIMKQDKIISRTDTPALLQLSVIDILDGGILNPGMNAENGDKGNDVTENVCSIKVQTANKKQSFVIPLKEDQQFKALFANCAEQLGVNESSLKFYFDGEQIEPTDTPQSLDLEGEACIDLHIS